MSGGGDWLEGGSPVQRGPLLGADGRPFMVRSNELIIY